MQNIEIFLTQYIKPDEKIILGCSAGPDSMFLLYKILETKYAKNLIVCYFNHKTRPETDEEEIFIAKLGKKEGFTVEVAECDFEKIKKLYPSKSFEELAREKRYAFFDAISHIHNTRYVLTAHHLDDKIETFFFNLARGSKLTGLINMTESSGSILRPLLGITKKEILDYLDSNNLEYKVDSSNAEIEYTRNYIRHEIIPKFSEVNSNYKNNISKTLSYFEELKNSIDEEVKKFLLLSKGNIFSIKEFNSLPSFMQKEVIRYIYYISNNKSTIGLSEANIAEVIRFINGKNNKTIKEIQGLKMEKDNLIIRY
ncbi:tRNA lysidine(34) synthetase TilS [Candidatus Gracilibacteria bacterium 28_42_T64]|nr:tRNA lysidine(34) synthetase TilS [Candidatus Gracilibacteria bacterium 28_42_T64]